VRPFLKPLPQHTHKEFQEGILTNKTCRSHWISEIMEVLLGKGISWFLWCICQCIQKWTRANYFQMAWRKKTKEAHVWQTVNNRCIQWKKQSCSLHILLNFSISPKISQGKN
jgi:hypothetical protein